MAEPLIVIIGQPEWAVSLREMTGHYRWLNLDQRDRYVEQLAENHAALVLVDAAIPDWGFWTWSVKTSPATRRIPVVLVSADPSQTEAALTQGADTLVTPEALLAAPDAVLGRARVFDSAQADVLAASCAEPLPPEAVEALERFNAGDYYRQHDLFEALWMAEPGPIRDLYRAILQVGIGYYQITRGSHRGATKMLLRSLQWLALLPDVCQGVDIAALKADSAAVRAELARVGETGLAEFDMSLLKPVKRVGE